MFDIRDIRRKFRVLDLSVIDYVGSYFILILLLIITGTKPRPVYFASILPVSVLIHTIINKETGIIRNLRKPGMNPTKLLLTWYTFFLVVSIFTGQC